MLFVDVGWFSSRDSTMQSTITASMGLIIRRNQGHVGTCRSASDPMSGILYLVGPCICYHCFGSFSVRHSFDYSVQLVLTYLSRHRNNFSGLNVSSQQNRIDSELPFKWPPLVLVLVLLLYSPVGYACSNTLRFFSNSPSTVRD